MVSPTGEGDVIKYIQTLPGVSSGSEGSSAIYARGGNLGNNAMTLDGVQVYGTSHLLGFSSVLPLDIVSSTNFYVGGFRGDDANMTASHIKMTSKDGDMHSFTGNAYASNFLVGTTLSFPIVKDKVSFVGSVRVSPLGLEYMAARKLINNIQDQISDFSANSYDIYGKLKCQLSSNQSLAFSVFHSGDAYGYTMTGDPSENMLKWSNLIANIQYEASRGGYDWKLNLSYNNNASAQEQTTTLSSVVNYLSVQNTLRELALNGGFSRQLSENITLKSGASLRYNIFNPGTHHEMATVKHDGKAERPSWPSSGNTTSSILASLYSELEYKTERFETRAALRANAFVHSLEKEAGVLVNPEASVLARYNISANAAMEATVDYRTQYLHTLEGMPMGWSLDMIVPSDERIRPEQALQYYLGFLFNAGIHHFSLGAYYKSMKNLVYYRNAQLFFSSTASGWRDNIELGTGTSYGGEFLYEVEADRFNARVAYTLSKSDRLFPNLNKGKVFPAKYDRRHVLNAGASYDIISRANFVLSFNTFFTYQSGHWESVANCIVPGWQLPFEDVNGQLTISSFNDVQMPFYMRWDNSVSAEICKGKHRHNISVGVYNTLNRHNPSMVIYNDKSERWQTLSLIPIMPSLNYKFEF